MISIGDYTYGKPKVYFSHYADLKIGRFCSIAENVTVFLGGEHRVDWLSTYPFFKFGLGPTISGHPKTKGNVIIGNDVWIGYGVIIMSGVTIGNGAVIGAGSVVRTDLPDYSISYGNPAEVKRYRFSQIEIDFLNKIEWWNWSEEKIKQVSPLLMNCDIKGLESFCFEERL